MFSSFGFSRETSSFSPLSNGRADVAVKSAKRLLMNNISVNGTLDKEELVRALMRLHNTPDTTCKLSPAKVIFGRRLRDISKDVSTYNLSLEGSMEPQRIILEETICSINRKPLSARPSPVITASR